MNPLAFPRTAFNSDGDITTFEDEFKGMTLRDYFAAKAMQAEFINIGVEGNDPKFVALMAYEVADAMLKARG